MSKRIEGMLADIKADFGVDVEDVPDVLCDGDTCRHDECDCWDMLRSALEEKAMELNRLFIGYMPAGIVYADRRIERGGDYKRLGFLCYDTLKLTVEPDCTIELRAKIERDAAFYKPNQILQVGGRGQSITLGTHMSSYDRIRFAKGEPVEIAEDDYMESLEVLPPIYLTDRNACWFAMMEAYDFTLDGRPVYYCFAKIHAKYYGVLSTKEEALKRFDKLRDADALKEGTVKEFREAAASGRPLSLLGLSNAIQKERS